MCPAAARILAARSGRRSRHRYSSRPARRRPASGVGLVLSAPRDTAPRRLESGPDGRVCWDGMSEALFGELSLDPKVEPALGLPASRYVSREASYRLFVVKASR